MIVTAVRDVTVCFVADFIFLNAENVCRFRPIPFIVISHKKKTCFCKIPNKSLPFPWQNILLRCALMSKTQLHPVSASVLITY